MTADSHRSAAAPLAWIYAALIVYASLYPFTGWRVPGLPVWSFLDFRFPWYWTGFDLISNLLGYLPLGALTFGAQVRAGRPAIRSLLVTVALGACLSLTMELLQGFLPRRVSSNLDLALNVGGAALGALLAAVGLYGSLATALAERRRELAIRLIVGAQPRVLSASVLRSGLTLGMSGAVIGVAGGLLLGRAMRSLLWEVAAFDVVALAVALAAAGALAALGSLLPARRVLSEDPVEALRS
jgi:VanZ family protein